MHPAAARISHHVWSYDFVMDQTNDGKAIGIVRADKRAKSRPLCIRLPLRFLPMQTHPSDYQRGGIFPPNRLVSALGRFCRTKLEPQTKLPLDELTKLMVLSDGASIFSLFVRCTACRLPYLPRVYRAFFQREKCYTVKNI